MTEKDLCARLNKADLKGVKVSVTDDNTVNCIVNRRLLDRLDCQTIVHMDGVALKPISLAEMSLVLCKLLQTPKIGSHAHHYNGTLM